MVIMPQLAEKEKRLVEMAEEMSELSEMVDIERQQHSKANARTSARMEENRQALAATTAQLGEKHHQLEKHMAKGVLQVLQWIGASRGCEGGAGEVVAWRGPLW